MNPQRGQPPKGDDKRKPVVVYASPSEKADIEEARNTEAPDRRIGAYIRDVAVDHARQVIGKK